MADYAAPTANGGSFADSAASAFDSVTNGPVAQSLQQETEKTSNELSNLAAARRTPSKAAATGQPLTHYHSFFSELLSWNNPRASGIAYISTVASILLAEYGNFLPTALYLLGMTLIVTITAEVLGKIVLNKGLATHLRPHKYYTVSRETLDAMIGDVHELVNFFVVETQRIVFAENVAASIAACVAAFAFLLLAKTFSYYGLAVIATTIVFFAPLIYTTNQEIIDEQVHNVSELVTAQTAQVRDVTQKQMEQVSALGKQYAGDYTGKVQEMLRGKGTSRQVIDRPAASDAAPAAKQPEFPSVPTEEPNAPLSLVPDVPSEDPAKAQTEVKQPIPEIPGAPVHKEQFGGEAPLPVA